MSSPRRTYNKSIRSHIPKITLETILEHGPINNDKVKEKYDKHRNKGIEDTDREENLKTELDTSSENLGIPFPSPKKTGQYKSSRSFYTLNEHKESRNDSTMLQLGNAANKAKHENTRDNIEKDDSYKLHYRNQKDPFKENNLKEAARKEFFKKINIGTTEINLNVLRRQIEEQRLTSLSQMIYNLEPFKNENHVTLEGADPDIRYNRKFQGDMGSPETQTTPSSTSTSKEKQNSVSKTKAASKEDMKTIMKQFMPEFEAEIMDILKEKEELKFNLIKFQVPNNPSLRRKFLIHVVTDFIDELKNGLIGSSSDCTIDKISYGAQINIYFTSTDFNKLFGAINLTDRDIFMAIINVNAYRSGMFIPTIAFDVICKNVISKYKNYLHEVISKIARIIQYGIKETGMEKLKHYPSLRSLVMEKMTEILKTQEIKTKIQVMNHIEAEESFDNISKVDFNFKVTTHFENTHNSYTKISCAMPEDYADQVTILREMAKDYLKTVDKTVKEVFVKYVIHFLVKLTIDSAYKHVVPDILSEHEDLQALLEVKPEINRMLKEAENSCFALHKALNFLYNV